MDSSVHVHRESRSWLHICTLKCTSCKYPQHRRPLRNRSDNLPSTCNPQLPTHRVCILDNFEPADDGATRMRIYVVLDWFPLPTMMPLIDNGNSSLEVRDDKSGHLKHMTCKGRCLWIPLDRHPLSG